MRAAHHDRHRCAQNADHLAHNSPFSPVFAEGSALWAPHQPKPRSDCHQTGGIALHEAPTRRQQTVRELHVVQNPHRHRHGGCRRARLRRPWAAGPGRTTSQRAEPHVNTPGPTGMEGAGGTAGPGCGARGRRQGQRKHTHTRPRPIRGRREACGAWPDNEPTPSHTSAHPAPLVWRASEGPEGTGGLRGAAPNKVRSPSLAGGRALRRPEHPWSHKQPQQAAPRAAAAQ